MQQTVPPPKKTPAPPAAPLPAPPLRAEPRPESGWRQLVRAAFAPHQNEPQATPGQYYFLSKVVSWQTNLIVFFIGLTVLTWLWFAPREIYHLIVQDRQGLPSKLVRLQPLDTPNMTRTAITNLALHIAAQTLTFGFNNADERILLSKHYFTTQAWDSFVHAYLDKNALKEIKTKQQILATIATDSAVIISEGEEDGVYRWVVQVPILTAYLAGSKNATVRSLLQLTFIRAPITDHPEGVAIDNWKQLGR